jgi:release factor glutamine methyltransferase
MVTVNTWLEKAHQRLKQVSDTADLDAQVLLASILHRDRSWVLAHPEYELAITDIAQLDNTLLQLQNSTPLPYITGRAHFYGLEFHITPDVLIPRPETELLVDHAIQWCQKHQYHHLILDVGTGSGCIAISLAVHFPHAKIIALDISMSALRVAYHNAILHSVKERCNFLQSDLITPISGKFGLICANLPYIPSSKLASLTVARSEPMAALDGGESGLVLIQKLLQDSVHIADDRVCLLLEIEAEQGVAASELARKYYPGAKIDVKKDLSGLDRLLVIERGKEW